MTSKSAPPPDLFADQGPEFAPQSDRLEVVAGKVVATMNKPSAVQKRFNTLMERIATEQALANALRHAMDTHGSVHRQALHELNGQSQVLLQQMVRVLDARIQAPAKPKGLTPTQKQQATRMLQSLCDQFVGEQDTEMETLIARYGPDEDELADSTEQSKLEAQELLESFLGDDFSQGRTFETPEDVLRAAMEYEQKKHQAREEKLEAKRAARKAKKGQSAKETAAEQKEMDAQSALRTVFRQLASALHPDREPDEQERARKTALMSEVNAAYERKDLSTLLRLQLQAVQVDAAKASALSDAKLKAMCDLLAEQVKVLDNDNHQLRFHMEHAFGYPVYMRFKEPDFLACLHEERAVVQAGLDQMQADLRSAQDEQGFKAWLKSQTRMMKEMERERSQDFGLDDMLYSMMRRG
jgi:hypothetical protein